MINRSRWRFALLSCVALAAGIGIGAATGAHRAEAAAAKKTLVYVHERGATGQIAAFRLDSRGNLTTLTGSPFAAGDGGGCGGNCNTLAYSERRKLLFAGGGDGLHVFNVATDGSLSEVSGSPFGAVDFLGVAVVEKGDSTFVYAADDVNEKVRGYAVQENGALVELGSSPLSVAGVLGAASTKDLVFLTSQGHAIAAFRAQNDGSLTAAPGSPFELPSGTIFSLQLDPAGKTLYAAIADSPAVRAFGVNPQDASLTPLVGSPFATLPLSNQGVAVGKSRVVVSSNLGPNGDLQAMKRLGTGVLKPLGPVRNSGLAITGGGALDPKGKVFVTASGFNDAVRSFRLNQKTGALNLADTDATTLSNPTAVLMVQR